MTGAELDSGTGAAFTISGSTPGGGLIIPPLASNLTLRFFSWSTLPPCAPPGRDASVRDKSNAQCTVSDSSVVDSLNHCTLRVSCLHRPTRVIFVNERAL